MVCAQFSWLKDSYTFLLTVHNEKRQNILQILAIVTIERVRNAEKLLFLLIFILPW